METTTSTSSPDPSAGAGNRALIVHVHVPKTAGSAVNSYLGQNAGEGRDHIQATIGAQEAFDRIAGDASWVAGHVPAPRFRQAVAAWGGAAYFITAIREPLAQVASHYNWLIEIGNRGEEFLNGHPDHIKAIHHRIAGSDNSDPDVIIRNLSLNPGLFLNCQARFVVGPDFANPDISFAAALDWFDAVLTSRDIPERLAPFLGGAVHDMPTVNKSPYHFDKEVFSHQKVRRFLMDRNRADATLWALAQDMQKA